MNYYVGDPGDQQEFVHNLADVKINYEITKILPCIACDAVVQLEGSDRREAVLCDDCKDVFKKAKGHGV